MKVFPQQLWRNVRLGPEHELLALFLGLDGLGRELSDVGDERCLARQIIRMMRSSSMPSIGSSATSPRWN